MPSSWTKCEMKLAVFSVGKVRWPGYIPSYLIKPLYHIYIYFPSAIVYLRDACCSYYVTLDRVVWLSIHWISYVYLYLYQQTFRLFNYHVLEFHISNEVGVRSSEKSAHTLWIESAKKSLRAKHSNEMVGDYMSTRERIDTQNPFFSIEQQHEVRSHRTRYWMQLLMFEIVM